MVLPTQTRMPIGGITPEDKGEGEDDADDDGIDDDMLLATQPLDLPPLLS